MLLEAIETKTAFPADGGGLGAECKVLALLDWDYLPYELCQPGSGYRFSLLRGEDEAQAFRLLGQGQAAPDVLLVDEDFFGSPEATADACMRIRRTHPKIRIIAIESEMHDGDSVLEALGICQETLPAMPDVPAILEKLTAFNCQVGVDVAGFR
ncbi:hypothetical protein [Roseovarius sp. MMSF_3281]|uniref:hypothetical protein n=1 Tax=Roseovarius sp. MMSF_3281 TaxID=3046694 RepID=UPI00273DDF34|nr:hypothetical protein [Roseovarius sp. MMSF_3281]